MLTDFGQPLGGVVQFAYTVADIEEAMREYTARLKVGPWFVRGPFRPLEGSYRGQPCTAQLTLARAFCGHAMVELIQQHDGAPSVFQERIEAAGYGFHHWGIAVTDIDAAVAEYTAQGYPVAFSDRLPSGARIVYMDTLAALPGMVELIEFTPDQARHYTAMHAAAIGWDGTAPVRRTASDARHVPMETPRKRSVLQSSAATKLFCDAARIHHPSRRFSTTAIAEDSPGKRLGPAHRGQPAPGEPLRHAVGDGKPGHHPGTHRQPVHLRGLTPGIEVRGRLPLTR